MAVNFSDTTPSPPAGGTNVHWQKDGSNNVSAYLPSATGFATQAGVQDESYTYAADTGAANAYAVTLSPAPGSYAAGLEVVFKAANTNTGSSTLNVNGLGAITIKKADGATNLVAGEIVAGQIVSAVYDGTNFQMQSPGALVGGLPDPVDVPHGGTGDVTLSAHAVLVGEGTSAVAAVGPGAANYPLLGAGASADPAFQQPRGNTSVVQLADSTTNPTSGNLAKFDANGNVADSGISSSSVVPATPVENEIVTFSGTSGTLAHTPSSVTGYTQVKIYKNGQRLTPGAGNDFTWSGTAVTLAVAEIATDVFIADYWK